MSYQWPDENGRPVNLTVLTDEKLLDDTQRIVDAYRRFLDNCLRQLANRDGFENSACHMNNTKMTFTGRVTAMIEECQCRGLPININR